MEIFPNEEPTLFIDVILPLALPRLYTYSVPKPLDKQIQVGHRVEVQFGKSKLYSALVTKIKKEPPEYKSKSIISILDKVPIVEPIHLEFWEWLAKYYACTMGEVMIAALPAGLKLSSETKVQLSPVFDEDFSKLTDNEYLITEALTLRDELSIDEIRKILNQYTVYPLINSLLVKRVILLKEELKLKYKPRTVSFVRLAEPYRSDSDTLKVAFEVVGTRAKKQLDALLGLIQLSRQQPQVKKSELIASVDINSSQIKALQEKGIFEVYEKEVSRIAGYDDETVSNFDLTMQQLTAKLEIQQLFTEKRTVLLHGVTGSGKTQVYIDLMQEAVEEGSQVLYLLPEIGLTTQIISRLQRVFGNKIAVYHSRLNNHERVELWHETLNGKPIILGARSALFLPFKNLDLIIIDEEHDNSFKQQDPAPRYNARDAAIYLAHQHNARVLLGTATPSMESYVNARLKKYGKVEMLSRFSGLEMPEIIIANAAEETRKKTMKSHFTSLLLDELKQALERGEQAILFQNRRGYAPTMSCETCGWTAACINCDVTLTYHKFAGNLRCHYCGYQTQMPANCNACGKTNLKVKGFGTEKIEDELKIYLPEVKVARMDWDSVRTKNSHQKIITDFEEKKVDVLVGTQMVTKGLDFDNVGLVGVLSADNLLFFPDFRANERAFQLLTQVSGRSGRRSKRGKVVIQAFNTVHPVLKEVVEYDFSSFYEREEQERINFRYPPFTRLIKITLKHKKSQFVYQAARIYVDLLRENLGGRVLGPAAPGIARVRNYYLMDVVVKLERKRDLIEKAKQWMLDAAVDVKGRKGLTQTRINVDVDPY